MPILGINSAGGRKPGTPTSVSASAGDASATVSFTEPSNEGKTGTATYVATSSPSSLTGSSTTSPITVSSLSNGTAYTFTVIANTPYGVSSDTSSASGSVTPVAPPPPPPPPPPTWYCSVTEVEDGNTNRYHYTSSSDDYACSYTFAIVCSTSGYPAYPNVPC